MDEKKVKKDFLKKASKDPDKYFPTKTLKDLKFERYQCEKCKRFFWSQKKHKTCGDAACSGGFRFIGKKVTKKQLSYIDAWKEYAKIHKKLGYTPIERYPVVARWNPTVDFTIASIAAFQPYVVSGEIAPPANPLVLPQVCLRFSDIDNVGITGHFVGFVMLGEHAFLPPKDYDPNKFIKDHLTWLQKGMGLDLKDLLIHEDAWAGGGNLGPCMEFFSHGLEISNQVYMQYEIQPNGSLRELDIKVLDMGQGLERITWFTNGGISIYEEVFPPVMKRLRKITGVDLDKNFMKGFTPLAAYLNIDEVKDIDLAWQDVADKLGMSLDEVKRNVLPLAALYSVAEHARALLFALTDGALPSNVGGMYNLRVILRRALGFIEKYGWKIDLADVCAWHADYLQPLFPELMENLDDVKAILKVEKEKFLATQKKVQQVLPRILEKDLKPKDFVTLYDSQGISPELILQEAEKLGKKVKAPDNFYALLAARHEQKAAETKTEREEHLPLEKVQPTKVLYYDDCEKTAFDAKVLKIISKQVILDKSAFYPTSGGQVHDTGELNGEKVIDVFKQGPHIVHVMKAKPKFKAGEKVHGDIDFDRRIQLAQHHTATHIVNAAARRVLGQHVNQASAKKDVDKAHLDITHYEAVDDGQLELIETEANRLIKEGIKTELMFMPREKAEKEYGMLIYQGGAVPGKQLRIVKIGDIDVEACGGTHLKNTLDIGRIKMIKASKVQDGVVRLTFAAGRAAEDVEEGDKELLDKLADLLNCDQDQIPGRVEELFKFWKIARKLSKKGDKIPNLKLTSVRRFEGDLLKQSADLIKTQPQYVIQTVMRFLKDIEEFSK
ncbi:alanine--tRNA ligase [Candidatus Woesearchaeota archaeon]|nr:alanine--tRNA ligase [Candidatus Woesearchaeota archaeon]